MPVPAATNGQNARMRGHLITADGESHEITGEALRALIDSSTWFWLDLAGPDRSVAQTVLGEIFGPPGMHVG